MPRAALMLSLFPSCSLGLSSIHIYMPSSRRADSQLMVRLDDYTKVVSNTAIRYFQICDDEHINTTKSGRPCILVKMMKKFQYELHRMTRVCYKHNIYINKALNYKKKLYEAYHKVTDLRFEYKSDWFQPTGHKCGCCCTKHLATSSHIS